MNENFKQIIIQKNLKKYIFYNKYFNANNFNY